MTGRKKLLRRLWRPIGLLLDWLSFDARYGVHTSGFVPVGRLLDRGSPPPGSVWYQPAPAQAVKVLLGSLNCDLSQFVFLDLGCGAGRPILIASQFPFKKVIGVDISSSLLAIAENNISKMAKHVRLNSEVELICTDITHFMLPKENLCIFMFTPFKGALLDHLCGKLRKVVAGGNRVELLFCGRNPSVVATLDGLNWQKYYVGKVWSWIDFCAFSLLRSSG